MRKIAAVANSNAKKLASQGKLEGLTPAHIDNMEMRKAAYLVDYALNSVKESGAQMHPDVLTAIVKTANACIPAMSTLLPMNKFAALCDKVLEGAAFEVGNTMAKNASLHKKAEEMFTPNTDSGTVNNAEGEMDYVMELLKEIGLDAGTAGLFGDAEYDEQPEEAVVDKINNQIAGNNPVTLNNEVAFNDPSFGYTGPNMNFAPTADFNATNPLDGGASFSVVAELKYIDAMNEISKTAKLIQKMVKKAGEVGNSPEVAKQVEDEGTPSAAKPAEEKAAAAAKKPEVNSTTVSKPALTQKAVESDVKNITTFDSKEAPTLTQGNVNMNDGSTKMSSLNLDSLVDQCMAVLS
jgi:hypothetical protein